MGLVEKKFIVELLVEGGLQLASCVEHADGEIFEVVEVGPFFDVLGSAGIEHHISIFIEHN